MTNILKPSIAALSVGRDYEVEHESPNGSQKVEGTLIDLDEKGFVVIEDSNGKRIIINKNKVIVMKEK